MIIPKLFYQDRDPETGEERMRPATTEDINRLVDEYYEASVSLSYMRDMRQTGE